MGQCIEQCIGSVNRLNEYDSEEDSGNTSPTDCSSLSFTVLHNPALSFTVLYCPLERCLNNTPDEDRTRDLLRVRQT